MGVGADVNSVVGCRYGCYGVGQVVLVLEDVGVNVSVNILGVNVGVMGVGALGQAVWRRLVLEEARQQSEDIAILVRRHTRVLII